MSAIPVLRRALVIGVMFAAVLAVIGAAVGFSVAGRPGLISSLLGAVIAGVFLAITAVSILLASRYDILAFFGIVMGAWLLKFVLFIALAVLLRDQEWIDPAVLFVTLILGVIGTLIIDVVVVAKSRLPYVSDIALPDRNSTRDLD